MAKTKVEPQRCPTTHNLSAKQTQKNYNVKKNERMIQLIRTLLYNPKNFDQEHCAVINMIYIHI